MSIFSSVYRLHQRSLKLNDKHIFKKIKFRGKAFIIIAREYSDLKILFIIVFSIDLVLFFKCLKTFNVNIGKEIWIVPLQFEFLLKFHWNWLLILDLFEKMVPVSVQQSLAAYNQRKADLVNRSIAQMREATTLANG